MTLSNGNTELYPICKKIKNDTNLLGDVGILVRGTAYLVVFFSFILRKAFITLIGYTRETKNSKIASATMYSVLIVSFFNYGITKKYIVVRKHVPRQ